MTHCQPPRLSHLLARTHSLGLTSLTLSLGLTSRSQVAVNTDYTDVAAFLDHVLRTTNMRCLTPPSALEGESGFLAANLYAKSIFGEDALVNLSVEKRENRKICGYVRIRSKTQASGMIVGTVVVGYGREVRARG